MNRYPNTRSPKRKSPLKKILLLLIALVLIYAAGRLYYRITGGFTLSNISSTWQYDPRWETHSLSSHEKKHLDRILDQEYIYLGKGCQAYVFASRDGNYVIKFFKYQRFLPQPWINLFTFIPAVERYQQRKTIEKRNKLDRVFRSWKMAFDQLQTETGTLYVHLNKTRGEHKPLIIQDKIGREHQIDLDQTEFLVQYRAKMLTSTIESMMEEKKERQAEQLIDTLLAMLLFEYARGYADNDHALMQNTGVFHAAPIHIDVGQFIYNETVRSPDVYKRELYDKTYNFNKWLKKHFPQLSNHLQNRLLAIIGVDFFHYPPYKHKGNVGKIPHQDL